MERRKFLQNASIASLSLAAISSGCNNTDKSSETITSNLAINEEKDLFPLNEITIPQLQEKMSKGEFSSRKITELYLKRIEAIDQSGPTLKAIIEINPDALSIADAMDKERKEGKLRGPLHGIPILIKDNINSGDKMMTTAGALALKGNVAAKDAFIIGKLREAGAVLLGKTNLSEWANFRSTRSSSGWSSSKLLRHCDWHGNGWIYHCPILLLWHSGDQANGWIMEQIRHYTNFCNPGYCRAYVKDCYGRCHIIRSAGWDR